MSKQDLEKHQISLTCSPILAVCRRCSMAFTRGALFNHMKIHDNFNETPELFEMLLERSRVVRTFTVPSHPIPPLPGVQIFMGKRCVHPQCSEVFLNAIMLHKHVKSRHAGTAESGAADCELQEVHGLNDSRLHFRVLAVTDSDDAESKGCSHLLTTQVLSHVS